MPKKTGIDIPAIVVIRTIVFLIIGFIIFVLYSNTREYLNTAKLFQIQDVVIEQTIQFIDTQELKRLKGQNIFGVNIKALENRLRLKYPQITQMRVMRELPNRIKILAKKRDAVMQTKWRSKNLLIDADGVGMYFTSVPVAVPVVQGILPSSVKVIQGAPIKSRLVHQALVIIKKFQESKVLSKLKITSIDLTNLSKIDIIISSTLHILIDLDNLKSKLDVLESLVVSRKIDFRLVKYVDLRFGEPVIAEHAGP